MAGLGVAACSSNGSGEHASPDAAGIPGTAGAAAAGRGGTNPTGGGGGRTDAGSGGTNGAGGIDGRAGAAAATGGASGAAASGGESGGGGGGHAGGTAGAGGNPAGLGGAGGAALNTGPFVCNQVMPLTLTRMWFEAGFETDAAIAGSRWQLKAREHGYITEWANPNSDFWNQSIESPCANGSTNPDHVVLMVLSWTCCKTAAEWEAPIDSTIANLKARYAALRRVDLMTIIRGPGNRLCPTAPAAGETIVVPGSLDDALAAVASRNPGFVFVAPKWEAADCGMLSGGGPEFTAAGNAANAKTLAAYFSNIQ